VADQEPSFRIDAPGEEEDNSAKAGKRRKERRSVSGLASATDTGDIAFGPASPGLVLGVTFESRHLGKPVAKPVPRRRFHGRSVFPPPRPGMVAPVSFPRAPGPRNLGIFGRGRTGLPPGIAQGILFP